MIKIIVLGNCCNSCLFILQRLSYTDDRLPNTSIGCLYQNIDSIKLRNGEHFNHSDWASLPILPNDKSKGKDGNGSKLQ
ncbi:hypothetical protein Avbf_03131, partial [Armadillidium vulgare]